jgi:hypothetical protein
VISYKLSCKILEKIYRNKNMEISKYAENLVGQRFGKLTVIEFKGVDKAHQALWLCKCDCGNEIVVKAKSIKHNHTNSCGCLRLHCNLVDLTGQKFGRLAVLKLAYTTLKKSYWLCKCSCDDKEVVVQSWSLQSGHTKSCGCLQKETIGNLRALPDGDASFNTLYSAYRGRANKKGIIFDISIEDFKRLVSEKCFYDGVEPYRYIKDKGRFSNKHLFNGLDRIDNTKGYTLDNVVPCCKECNIAKNNMSLEDFKNWTKRLYKNLIEKENKDE